MELAVWKGILCSLERETIGSTQNPESYSETSPPALPGALVLCCTEVLKEQLWTKKMARIYNKLQLKTLTKL